MSLKQVNQEKQPLATAEKPAAELLTDQAKPEQELVKEQEKQPAEIDKKIDSSEPQALPKKKLPFLQKSTMPIPQVRDEMTLKIEKILEEGLDESFQRLSPIARQEFKLKGEQTALKIRDLLKSTHIKFKKVLKLILEWLRVLPGVNRFFIEQEAKIKAEKITALKNKQ